MNLELKELVENALCTAPDRSILTTSKQIDENFQQKTPEHYHEIALERSPQILALNFSPCSQTKKSALRHIFAIAFNFESANNKAFVFG
ncbi:MULTISPECIES: hypothetical protein [unclassified Microcoleus]|uniref:hypothetical protein n=1 Tax=unclassified Microcoleus TaxID=2642155 RepID=UPI0025EAEA85|nr:MULTISPECIES: hypothetical protein [unclassified Microcoleus]